MAVAALAFLLAGDLAAAARDAQSDVDLLPPSVAQGSSLTALQGLAEFPASFDPYLSTMALQEEESVNLVLVVPQSIRRGTEFEINMQVDDVENFAGGEFVLHYDPSVLSFLDAQRDDQFLPCLNTFPDSGTSVKLLLACNEARAGAPLDLWTVKFAVDVGSGVSESELSISDSLLFDEQTEVIPSEGSSERMVVLPEICGDQNGDEQVDIADVVIDLRISSALMEASPIQEFLSNLDREPGVNIEDAELGIRHIVGLFNIEGCGPAS